MAIDRALPIAHQLADAAGEVLRKHFKTTLSPETKTDGSPVTIADKEAENAMREILTREFPQHGIFGEEGERVNPEAEWQWVLDPIDGTRAFIAGFPTFTTLIALCHQGVPQLGIIDQPVLKERWQGVKGRGSAVRDTDHVLATSLLSTTSMRYFTEEQREKFLKLRAGVGEFISGGDAYAYAMLTIGRLNIVVDAVMKPYDYLALPPIIEAAGGVITDWKGKPLTLHSDGTVLAACNPALHQQALGVLRA